MNALRANRIAALQKAVLPVLNLPLPLTEGPTGRGIVRNGHAFSIAHSFEEINPARVTAILEASFTGKKVAPGFFDRDAREIIVELENRALAITMQIQGVGGTYLDKIAVTPQAQGTGIAKTLMAHLRDENPVLAWRATKTNPANAWYARLGTTIETPEWNIYGWGMSMENLAHAAQIIARLPPTMICT